MSDLKICRICVRTEAKMYKFGQYQLMYYYEEVMALKVFENDGLPQYFCYECATLLHKFRRFKEKCYKGYNALKELLYRGPLTYERVYKIDRKSSELTSPLSILKVSKNVKTYSTANSLYIDTDDDNNVSVDIKEKAEDPVQIVNTNVDQEVKLDNSNIFSDCDDHHDEYVEMQNDAHSTNNKTDGNNSVPVYPKLNKPQSPTTIFIDEQKEIIKLENEPVKESNETIVAIVEPAKQYKFKKPTKFLDANHWKKVTLTEDEALKQFREKVESAKYLACPFKCSDCYKGFSKQDILKRHRRLRHDESLPLECRFCRMRYKWNVQLRKHMRQHFNKFECLRCHLVCPLESTAILHEDLHNGVVKKCIHCGEEFTHLSSYYSHLRTHRSEYVCTHCGVSFVSPTGLKQHKRLKHIDDEIESPDDDEEVNTYCEKCDIRFETRKAYNEHLFHSAMHVDGLEQELKDEFSIPRKILGQREKRKITKALSKSKFQEVSQLKFSRKMTKRKKQKKPTDCYQCGKHFETQAACLKHHLAEHPRTSFFPPSSRHICEICGASLAPGSVANHQNMHSKKKIFSCDICGRSFNASISLKRHMLTHTGERPYGCTLCEKKFTQSNSMKLHYKTFHLKQPYPKRIRRKKEEPKPVIETEESREEASEDSMPDAARTEASHDDIQYLTLH